MKIIVVIFVLFEKEEKKDMTTCKVHILYKEIMFILRVSSNLILVNRIIYGLVM